MQKRKNVLARVVIAAALLYPGYVLAQISGEHSSGGAASGGVGGVTGSPGTTGIASDQAQIPPPGTNSLGTANSSDVTTGLAGTEPKDSRHIDAQIRAEDARIDAKINGICKGC
jgi:hypothetical protein